MATDIVPNRGIHDEFKKSAFFKTPIQEEDEDTGKQGLGPEFNSRNSINEPDSSTMELDNDDSETESEPEEINDEIRENYDVSQSLKEVARVLRLASQEPDDTVLQNVKEYRRNFEGFAEIVPFESIDTMHEFIRTNLKSRKCEKQKTSKQEIYLEILLRVKPEDRFSKLLESCDSIVRRIVLANRVILEQLLKTARIDKLPCPFASDSENFEEDEDEDAETSIKPWYMLEMIGIWLNFVNDPQTFRDKLRNELLEKRLSGISVPLKFK